MQSSFISSGFVEDALTCLRHRNINIEPIMESVDLVYPLTSNINKQQYGKLWLAIANATDDEFFGMSKQAMRRGSFSLLCHAVLHAGTLGKALSRALQFLRIVMDEPYGELNITEGKVHIKLICENSIYPAFTYRTFWLILLGLLCWLISRRISIKKIGFACSAPENRSDYHQFFGVPVLFEQVETALIFDASYLSLPIIRSEQALKNFLHQAPGNLLVRYSHDEGWVGKIRSYLKVTPMEYWLNFEQLSIKLKIQPATLRRRLREEGHNFACLKDEVRNIRAQTLLNESDLSVVEIAFQLGYSEPSAFHRAFKNWNDLSPAAFRHEIRSSRIK